MNDSLHALPLHQYRPRSPSENTCVYSGGTRRPIPGLA